MRVADLIDTLERLAPVALAQPGDNCGLLVGDPQAPVRRLLVALEMTAPVLEEAAAGDYDTVLTHHPLLFSPVRSLVEARPRERLLRALVERRMSLIACHTNLDAAPGGLADIAGEALGLSQMVPLEMSPAGWCRLVGFVPEEALEAVAAAVFAAGAGWIGDYKECAFATRGTGWFTAMPGSHPTIGELSRPERTPEIRFETVVPKGRLAAVIRAYVACHPYEEPAFDVYPVDDLLPRAGIGRVGALPEPVSVRRLAQRVKEVFETSRAEWSGDPERMVRRVAVLPGSGRGSLDAAPGRCDVLVTGDVGYHAADQAAEAGLSLIDVPHGEFEWWAFRRWTETLRQELRVTGVDPTLSERWRSPWSAASAAEGCRERSEAIDVSVATQLRLAAPAGSSAGPGAAAAEAVRSEELRIWIDGGSRGNPGPSAIGVVVEDRAGNLLAAEKRTIGVGTNNVAEYRALLTGLEMARTMGAQRVEVASDSELLVRQMRGGYRVKNEGLRPLYEEALERLKGFANFRIRHVDRGHNARADALVNQALDEQQKAGL